ncbi:hypothetical protein F5X98DRAFT_337682 [Xylaria grammica]|nr:hypothetical protein F5X98DRAFT_337682 [Xylaria grammica]
MADPLTITKVSLAGVSFLAKAVDGCIAAYNAYKISAAFGEDWVAAHRRYTIQQTKLKTLSKVPISWFADNLQNEQDEVTIAVKLQLAEIESHFIRCRDIIKKYHDIEKKLQEKKEADEKAVALDPPKQPTKAYEPRKTNLLRKMLPSWKLASKSGKAKKARGSIGGASATASVMTESTVVVSTRSDDKSISQPPSLQQNAAHPEQTEYPTVDEETESAPEFVIEELQKAGTDAQERQHALGFYNALRWVDHDRENFYKELENIEDGNRELESLLKLKSDVDPLLVLGDVDDAELDRRMLNAKHIQTGARRLHAALIRANTPGAERRGGAHFSMQVHEEPDKLAFDLLESSGDLPINIGDCWVFAMHCHTTGRVETSSILLYAKTNMRPAEYGSDAVTHAALPGIYEKLATFDTDHHDEYELLGQVKASDTVEDSHLLVAHTLSRWESPRSLNTVLAEDHYVQSSVTNKLQLARLMIVGFLYMKEVLATTEKCPRPDEILFYSLATDRVAGSNEVENEILNPFLSIGFGQKKQGTGRPVGATSGLKKRLVNPLAELSLVLFQVASGMALDYGTGDMGFREAVKQARLNMHKVDQQGGGPLVTEVVQLCLDQSTGENLFKPVDEGDERVMERLRMWYQRKEEKLR